MSKADGTAFGRPFRPFIAVANSGNKPPYNGLNNTWNSYMEPYYQNWAHPDDGIEFIIYLHVLYWSGFYANDNNKPSNPTSQNDPNYDWSYLDGIEQGVDALRLGKAKLHFRWDTESSGIPDFLESQGDTFDGTGSRPVAAWHRTNVQNDARDFWTAFSARYNGAPWLAHISHEEDNPGPNPPGDWTGAGWVSGRANVVRHTYNLLTQHTVFLGQSSGVHDQLTDIPVGRMMDDPKPGAFGCGSSHSPYPTFDCTDGIIRGLQDFNGTIENPPGGIPKPIFMSSMPNGWGSRNDGGYGSSNPWGIPYPIPGETSNPPDNTLADPDWNAAQHCSYTAGEPRAPSPLDDSGLGQQGRDNAGVVPSMGVMVHPQNDTSAAWNRALTLFGGQGTRSVPAFPWDYEDGTGGGGNGGGGGGGGGGSGNEITVIQGFSTTQSWSQAMMTAHTNTNIIACIRGGGDIDWYLQGTNMEDNAEESWSTNPGDKTEGEVIFYQVAGPQRSAAQWDADIEAALTLIRGIYINLIRITLAPSPGGPDGAFCPSDGPNNINGSVRDSVTYNEIRLAISIVAARYTDVDWVECYCDSCDWYSDGIGHVTSSGGELLGEKMWNTLFAGLPPPSGVIAIADTLAGVLKNSGAIFIQNATLIANDTGDGLSITAVSDAANCTVSLDTPNSRISYTPASGFSGNSTFRYTLSGDGGTSDAQVTVPVANRAPTMSISWSGPGIAVNAGEPYGLGVQGSDPDGDSLTYAVERQPDEGSMVITEVPGQPYDLLTYTSLVTSSGVVEGGQISCTDDDLANPLKSNVIDIIWDVIPTPATFISVTMDEEDALASGATLRQLSGVTIDDISSLSSIVDAIDSLDVYATTRIVFDEFESAASYRSAFNSIKSVSDVMGEILDSSAMSQYSVSQFEDRVDEYIAEYGTEMDIWEIGNEVNGDWLGSTSSVVAKIEYAYNAVVTAGGTTALTLYYNAGCNSGSDEMFTWAAANVSTTLKNGLDYVLISYWEEDCNDARPDWGPIFTQLGNMFPNSFIGFSEVGSYGTEAERAEFMDHYYGQQISHPRYIGGHFWWYFKLDCIPKTKPLWTNLNTEISELVIPAGWYRPPTTVPDFANVEGEDWQVFRTQLHQDHIDVNAPTNASEGDTLVIVAAVDGSAAIDMTVEPNAGWVNRVNIRESGTSLAVFDKTITDSEPGTYVVRKLTESEEWCAFSLALPPGSTFDSFGETAGISTTAQAPSITPLTDEVMLLFVVASDDPDASEDAHSFTGNSTMIGNKWSSNTGGMVSLAIGYDTQTVAQATTARTLTLDIDGRWTGLTLAYTQQLSGYSGAFGGDTLLNTTGDGTGSICYTNTADTATEKNWLRVYAQWPTNNIASNAVRVTLNVGGVNYAEVAIDQSTDGGVMNQIYNITTPLPAGTMTLCIFDNATGAVFADAIRFDYSVGDTGFITFTRSIVSSGHLKLINNILAVPANAYMLGAGDTLFTFTKTCQANGLLFRSQEAWATLAENTNEWDTERSRQ